MILDAQGIGGVWAWSIGFWSALLVWPLSTVFFIVASFFGTRQDRPLMLIGGPVCFGPMFAVASFFCLPSWASSSASCMDRDSPTGDRP
jgi:hypothetical protein